VPTPGDVTFPVSTTGDALLPQYGAAWQKGVLQDSWADWDALPAARIYMMGESPGGVWKSYPTWPPPAVELPLYFTADRALSGEHQPPGQVAFTSDPSDPVPTRGGTNNLMSCTAAYGGTCGPYDQSSIENRPDVVTFTLPPTPGAIVGRIHADVWISTDLPDVDLFVRMTDVYPDGRSILMAQGIQRARYRTGVCPALLVPNEPTLVRVDLQSTALTIAAGHSLRVSISASAGSDKTAGGTHTLYAVNPQNGDEFTGTHPNRAGTIQILVGAGHESALVVPVVGGTAAPPDERPVTTACAGSATPPDGAATSSDAGLDGKDDDLHSGCGCHAVSAHGAAGTIPILIAIASILRRRRAQRLPACRLQNAGP
jgi:predicted acyl esterase